jgi:hypothetical protein
MITSRRVRRLAAPIVVTVAAAPGCSSGPPEDLHVNPPPQPIHDQTPQPSATIVRTAPIMNPPPVQVATDLPAPSGSGRVERLPNGSCIQYPVMGACPPGAACNPPPPHPVQCPATK